MAAHVRLALELQEDGSTKRCARQLPAEASTSMSYTITADDAGHVLRLVAAATKGSHAGVVRCVETELPVSTAPPALGDVQLAAASDLPPRRRPALCAQVSDSPPPCPLPPLTNPLGHPR